MSKKRKCKDPKNLIYVFCEGQSEILYIEYFKTTFNNVIILKPEQGMIPEAKIQFEKDPEHMNSLSEINEIWFFFDTENYDKAHWNDWLNIIKTFNKSRKTNHIKIRLLMTTSCIEYWFLLHYKKTAPQIQSKADKDHIFDILSTFVSNYSKTNKDAIWEIASKYKQAINNGEWTLHNIESIEPIPSTTTLDRNSWLFMHDYTFTTVHEAISYLDDLFEKARVL